jgi:hypothetical protein
MELMILRSFFDLIKDICELKVILVKDFLIKSDLISKERKKIFRRRLFAFNKK